MFERVTIKESKPVRDLASKIINYLQEELKEKYVFSYRLVGSAAWNTILRDKNGCFDVDYQLLLTSNSREYKENKLNNPTKIKNDFFNCINKLFKGINNIKVENSTTAITIIDKKNKYSIDLVIMKLYPNNNEIIRRNNQAGSSVNGYTWNILPKVSEAYIIFDELSLKEKQELIEKHVLPRKAIEKAKKENDVTKKSSYESFIEEINNYVFRKNYN